MNELREFIGRARNAAAGPEPVQAVVRLLEELLSAPRPQWSRQGDDVAERLLYHDGRVTIYLIRGEPLRRFPPHEHCMAAVVAMLEGTETHRFFVDTGKRLAPAGMADLTGPCVRELEERVIHAVEYRSRKPVVAIHVYLGDLVRASRRMWGQDGADPGQYDQARYDALAMDIGAETDSA